MFSLAHQPDQLRQLAPRRRRADGGRRPARASPPRRRGSCRRGGAAGGRSGAPRTPPRPAEDRRVQGVGGRLVDQDAAADPLLEQAVELAGRSAPALAARHQPSASSASQPRISITAADRPLQPEAVAAREGRPPLGQGVEPQQLQLRRREEPRWPASITRSRVEPERGGDRTKTAGGFFGRRPSGRRQRRGSGARKLRQLGLVDRARPGRRRAAAPRPPRRTAGHRLRVVLAPGRRPARATVGASKITTTWTISPSSSWSRLIEHRAGDRVAAQGEEVVVDADARRPPAPPARGRPGALERRARRDGLLRPSRRRVRGRAGPCGPPCRWG